MTHVTVVYVWYDNEVKVSKEREREIKKEIKRESRGAYCDLLVRDHLIIHHR